MGADTQVTDGARPNNHTRMEKITKNNGYLICGSGDSQIGRASCRERV